jgi:flavin-dependent dehydrogenase
MRLRAGSRIAVVGGGPAGSFFAHFARSWVDRLGLPVSVTIFDGKDFLERGPRGCNLCAGIIAGSLEARLGAEGLSLPEQRIISRVEGYALHVEDDILRLTCEENTNGAIATVFRGNGPRYASFPDVVSFDDYLLSWARDRGAEVVSRPVWGIRPPSSPSNPLTVLYGEKQSPRRFEADLVVGAFGVNTHLVREIRKLGLGYVPPKTLTTFQAEVKLGQDEVVRLFGNDIHVFFPPSRSVRYATITPKKNYVTITVIGKKNASPDMVREFFELETIRRLLPPARPHCFCFPRIVVSAARRPFGDRLVLIGDAGFCRHYKNGIESAFHTARLAADAAFGRGIDAASLSTGYDRPARRLIARDNLYGRALFGLNDIISAIPLLSRTPIFMAKKETLGRAGRKIRFILWNMFTGAVSYRQIFLAALDPRLQISLLRHTIWLLFRRMKKALADR